MKIKFTLFLLILLNKTNIKILKIKCFLFKVLDELILGVCLKIFGQFTRLFIVYVVLNTLGFP